jgi:hypothetical protein
MRVSCRASLTRTTRILLFLLLAFLLPARAQVPIDLDEFGGLKGIRRAATGYFRTTRAEGRWWLVDPEGFLFRAAGVNSVSLRPQTLPTDMSAAYREAALGKYRSDTAWAKAAADRLRGWGFNTVGPGADRSLWTANLAYTVSMKCTGVLKPVEGQAFPDIFTPAFEDGVRRHAQRICRPRASDRWLLGYITDSPLDWGSDDNDPEPLIAVFLGLADDAPGRRELLGFLERRYLNIAELNAAWHTDYLAFSEIGRTPQVGSRLPESDVDAFQRLVAAEYFRVVHDAIRAVDQYHLILGPRFVDRVPRPVLEAMDEYVNAVSLDCSGPEPPADLLREIHRVTGWPVLVTRFGPPVDERPSSAPLPGPAEVGEQYESFVKELLDLPMVIGYSWFSYVDTRLPEARTRANTLPGLVDVDDDPHPRLLEAVARANGSIYPRAPGDGGRGRAAEGDDGE